MAPADQPPTTTSEPAPAPAEVRQRWRLTYRRRPDAPALAQREQMAAWEAALIASGLPLAGLDLPTPRPRLVFGAPLTAGMAAEAEVVDVFLVERRPVADLRERLLASLPEGHELVDAHDVWLGEPPLSGQVAAADYLVEIGRVGPGDAATPALEPGDIERGVAELLAAGTIPRTRDKGGRTVAYDLRPLLGAITVLAATGAPGPSDSAITLRIRTRFDPERGVGRPEEVVAALGEAMGMALVAHRTVRERLILAGDR